ncbi:clustered mitochondria protein homolog isoform X1 [Anguilla rostrata]|uniref:clustered mitochondria protein homolog isoform X1 n=2 Tax=Anguilla rostrata TaxID=7938 RepID=UPI0030CD16E4
MKDRAKREGGDLAARGVQPLMNGKKAVNTAMGTKEDAGQLEDTSFPVKIQGAGIEPFELEVHGFWLVQDTILAVLAREEVVPRTSLSLSFSGIMLDPLTELQTVKGLKAGATLRLVEEPYNPRTARAHLARLQELLRASGPHDALREGLSPSLLDTLCPTHSSESSSGVPSGRGTRRSVSDTKPDQTPLEGPPPDFILPGSQEHPLLPLLPNGTHSEAPSLLLDLSLSCWNPPPGPRKLQGDFLYISVCTLEGRNCDITSSPRGFYLNRSTVDVFDPRPATTHQVSHCLTDLLSQISPGFKMGFTALRNRARPPPLESMPTPYRTLSWLGPSSVVRSHRNPFNSRLGLEEHVGSQAPDWNDELQAARDLPQGTIEERLLRDRALLQVNSAFVWAAAQGAESVIDGCVSPINGVTEDPAFLWGGLFFSRGGDGGGTQGGERGKRAGQRLELKGVQAYSDLEGPLQNLHTLPTAVVDYRGVRLSAQGLAPGLEGTDRGPDSLGPYRGLLYGYAAGVQEGPHRRKLLELLAQAAKSLAIQRHAVLGPNGHQVPLFSSVDVQGLLGADGRFYLLDLFRIQPADANFHVVEKEGQEDEEREEGWPTSYSASTGLPRPFPHGLCRLRSELLRAFIQHKMSQFSQRVKERMEESGGAEECMKDGDPRGTDAVRGACKDVGSVSDIIFEMRFNPDIFSQGVQHPSSDSSATRLHERILREAAAFVVTKQIPAFVEDCLQFTVCPMDGATLRHALHQRGINLRYLGQVVHVLSQSEQKERLKHIMRLVFGEIVMRSARRILNTYLQGVEVSSLSAAVSHFLCCLLVPHFSSASVVEEPKKRSRRRGRGGGVASDSTTWSALSGSELWSLVNQDAKETYNLTDSLGTSVDHLVERYGLQKVSLLRELCLKAGIQLRLKEYTLDNRSKAPIGPDDILNILPVVKHVEMRMSDASKIFRSAQTNMQKGNLQQAYEQLKEAAYMYTRVCDDLHPEACSCLSSLARLAYLQGHSGEARSVQLRVVVISERVLGFDHPNTIQEYAVLAVYMFAGGELGLAQRCLYRAKLLMLLVHGEEHPFTATLDSSLGLVLQGEQSVKYLQSALKLNTLFHGSDNLQTALNQHLLAQRLCTVGDYRGAMTHEREALAVFQSQCGEDHPQTRCSTEFLGAITQQAVQVERSLRQGGAHSADAATPDSLAPSMDTTLEQLALVNGILKPTISNKIEVLKEKFKEMKASAIAANEKSELAAAVNGGVREENPANGVEVAGEDALNEGLEDQVSEASAENEEKAKAECYQEEMNSSEKTEAESKASEHEPKSESVLEEKGDQVSNEEPQSGGTDPADASLVTNGETESAANGTDEEVVTKDQLQKDEITGGENIEENVELGSKMKVLEQKAMTTDDQSGKSTTDEENRMLTNEGSESAEVNGEGGSHVEVTG